MTSTPVGQYEPTTSLHTGRRRGRFCYSKVEGHSLKFVIFDIGENREDWSEQESGEVEWYPFTPSLAESRLIRGLIDAGHRLATWQLVTLSQSGGNGTNASPPGATARDFVLV